MTALETPVNGMKVRTGDDAATDASQLATSADVD
jgi:hypothetical protein